MFTSGNGGLWMVRIRADKFRLWFPMPMYVLTDLLLSLEDLCEVILPRFGLPNYAKVAREFVLSLVDMPWDEPVVEVRSEDADVIIKRIGMGGE